jgi:SAM-dependent methyltransferase
VRGTSAPLLRCPRCHADGALRLTAEARDVREVTSGALTCSRCGRTGAVTGGVADLLHDPPPFVTAEAAGLRRFAERMRADGWDRERVLRLPDEPSPYWHGQRASLAQLARTVAFRPGQRLLDVGANTCWASAAFARDGLEVLALDIATHELQGLDTARWWMERDGTHFERLLGVMYDLPVASATLDHVFCCEVLHHNGLANLRRTLREAYRVLKPGGTLSVIRETLRAPLTPQLRPGHEVAEFEGHEHAFLAATYLTAARAAGFRSRVLDPADHWVLSGEPFAPSRRRRGALKLAALELTRRRAPTRRAYRAYLHHVAGTVPLSFTAVKRP